MKGLDSYIYTLRRKNVNNSRIKTEVDKTSAWLTGEINSPPEQRSLDNFKQLQKACKEQGTALRRNVEYVWITSSTRIADSLLFLLDASCMNEYRTALDDTPLRSY